MEAYLDVCITQCPSCKNFYAEASWYAIELSSDLECPTCKKSFNAEKNSTDRLLVKFSLDESGKVKALSKNTRRPNLNA